MKKFSLTIVLVAVIVLTACASSQEAVMETPPVATSSAALAVTPAPTAEVIAEKTLPTGSYDKVFSGYWSDNGGWFIGSENNIGGNITNNRHNLYLTSDGGKTWVETDNLSEYPSLPVTSALFVNESVGLIGYHYDFEDTGRVCRTEDGGRTWTELTIPTLSDIRGQYWQREPYEIRAVNGNIELSFYISTSYYGGTGLLYTSVSTDMGKTWGAFSHTGEVNGPMPSGTFDRKIIYFEDAKNGVFVGSNDVEGTAMSHHFVFLTHDGGKTWTETGNMNDYYTLPVTCAYFRDDSLGFLGFHYDFEEAGKVFRTEDGGSTWTELSIPTLTDIPGYNWRSEARVIRLLGDQFVLQYFIATSDSGDTGRMYSSVSEDWGTTWGAFKQSSESYQPWLP